MKKMLINASGIVVRQRRKVVLDGASITLHHGEVVALVGANGVGKTTLLQVIAGYLSPVRGSIVRECAASDIALLADRPALYPDWSANEALQRMAQLYQADDQRVGELMTQFNLTTVANLAAKNLSHGYRQRLAMAQMLLTSPKVILLDEPGNGLDYQQRRALWPLLDDLKRAAGVMLISHDWVEVGAVADRVYVLKGGLCHELAMPQRHCDWCWLEFPDEPTADTAYQYSMSRDGRFVAVPAGAEFDQATVLTVSKHYPAQALQEKIDALA